MLFFSRGISLADSGILNGFVDYHSHLLPGVDDGVQTMIESLESLAYFERMGVKKVWLTPHVMEDMPNTTSYLKERFEELKKAYSGKILLHLAAEYMLDNLFEEKLSENDLLPLGTKANHLLIETSYFNPPMNLREILEKIRLKGYYPILAHPERYNYMTDMNYIEMKNLGVKFQINLPSLEGVYGKAVQEKARHLLGQKAYNYMGTDIHSFSHFNSNISKLKIRNKDILALGYLSNHPQI